MRAGNQAIFVLTLSLLGGCIDMSQSADRITPSIHLDKSAYGSSEPIFVDVYVKNEVNEDVERAEFSPYSSSVGLPVFHIRKAIGGAEIDLPPGLFSVEEDAWESWYVPSTDEQTRRPRSFRIPSNAKVHLLHGDLRQVIVHAGEFCREKLRSPLVKEGSAREEEYESVVEFVREFQAGGDFEVSVTAYSRSQAVRFSVSP
jgi:hypothetical protein